MSTTLSLETGEKIKLSDIVNLNSEFIDSFFDKFQLDSEFYSTEIGHSIEEDIKAKISHELLLKADNGSYSEVCSFLTEDSLVISFQVRYAVGSYALYKANYSDIAESLKLLS